MISHQIFEELLRFILNGVEGIISGLIDHDNNTEHRHSWIGYRPPVWQQEHKQKHDEYCPKKIVDNVVHDF